MKKTFIGIALFIGGVLLMNGNDIFIMFGISLGLIGLLIMFVEFFRKYQDEK